MLTSRDNTAQLFLLFSSIWITIGLDTLRATGINESFPILCIHPNLHCVSSLFVLGLLEARGGELDDVTSREITMCTCLILSNCLIFTNVEFLGK